MGDPRWQQPR
uniref:Uncharacterized protein n=1 Tax=Arundo donax TaxID=35708 RepID=A0A0A9B0J3_ARUDO